MPVIAIRKFNHKVVNGTWLRILELHEHVIKCKIISDCKYTGDIIDITHQVATTSEEENYFILKRRQFPIIPAFGLTIDKSQGQTITNNGIYLKTECFNHG